MKFAVREAVDVYFKAKSTFTLGARTIRANEPVLILDTVKTSTLDIAAATSYVTGGRGNARLLSYEGDKTLSFQFEDALLSNEGLAILAGADLIPARNSNLAGSSSVARSVIAHTTETYSVTTVNQEDTSGWSQDYTTTYDSTTGEVSSTYKTMGGKNNVRLSQKPYLGQNASIYVLLLDGAGEPSGAPIQIDLNADVPNAASTDLFIDYWQDGDEFIAFTPEGLPMSLVDYPGLTTDAESILVSTIADTTYAFDDLVGYYVPPNMATSWATAWGDKADYIRTINSNAVITPAEGSMTYDLVMLSTTTGVRQPKAAFQDNTFFYPITVPSILYQDTVMIDYYVEHKHNATQISILPDKFAPFMYVEGSSLVRRASDGVDLPIEFVIPKFKITTQLSLTLSGTGDASTFTFQGDAYPDYSKFDLTRKVLADIQILDADDNYDSGDTVASDPTSYRRFLYNADEDGAYIWKDPSMSAHDNIDISDTPGYYADYGGAVSTTQGGIGSLNGEATEDDYSTYPYSIPAEDDA